MKLGPYPSRARIFVYWNLYAPTLGELRKRYLTWQRNRRKGKS